MRRIRALEIGEEPPHPRRHMFFENSLVAAGRLSVELAFPYGSPSSSGANWKKPDAHATSMTQSDHQADFDEQLNRLRQEAVDPNRVDMDLLTLQVYLLYYDGHVDEAVEMIRENRYRTTDEKIREALSIFWDAVARTGKVTGSLYPPASSAPASAPASRPADLWPRALEQAADPSKQ